jgi:hypothetical protein
MSYSNGFKLKVVEIAVNKCTRSAFLHLYPYLAACKCVTLILECDLYSSEYGNKFSMVCFKGATNTQVRPILHVINQPFDLQLLSTALYMQYIGSITV